MFFQELNCKNDDERNQVFGKNLVSETQVRGQLAAGSIGDEEIVEALDARTGDYTLWEGRDSTDRMIRRTACRIRRPCRLSGKSSVFELFAAFAVGFLANVLLPSLNRAMPVRASLTTGIRKLNKELVATRPTPKNTCCSNKYIRNDCSSNDCLE